MAKNPDDKCASAMGCDGEKCMWSASRHSCQTWCRDHASQWSAKVVQALKSAANPRAPAMLMVDRLSIAGCKGMFIRCGEKNLIEAVPLLVSEPPASLSRADTTDLIVEHLSSSKISEIKLTVTVCGLMGDPPQDVVDSWDSQYSCFDLLEFSRWRGFQKKCISISMYDENKFLFRGPNGAYHQIDGSEAANEIAALMGDKSLKGTRILFSFDVMTTSWDLTSLISACEAFDVKTPGGASLFKSSSGYGGRTFICEPEPGCLSPKSCASGGVHVSLNCGQFVAQWHTMVHMTASFPMMKDGKASFKVVMLW